MAQPNLVGADQTLEQAAAGVLMVGFPSTSIPPETRELIALGVRSFILFGQNVGSAELVRSLTRDLQAACGGHAIIAIDHEGGRVNRLREAASPWPSPMAWSAAGDDSLVERASRVAAQELSSLGINLNFAPVADVLGDFRNPVLSTRCFSDDPVRTAELVTAFVRGHRQAGVGATAKHFPGHGFTPVDSHLDLPRMSRGVDELTAVDLIPFAAAVEADVDCLMVSHIWYDRLDAEATPASTSAAVMQLARNDLHFDGVIVTDSLEMGAIRGKMSPADAAVRAIVAGADLAMVSHDIGAIRAALDGLIRAVREGVLPMGRLVEANSRLDRLCERVTGPEGKWPTEGSGLVREISERAVTVVRDEEAMLPLRDATLGVVSFGSSPVSQAESVAPASRLGDAVRLRGLGLVEANAASAAPSEVLESMREVDTVLVGTVRAIDQPQQVAVVQALLNAGKQTVVVALRDPSDLVAIPQAPCFVVAYGEGEAELTATVGVLFGDLRPSGALPVAIPGLYPRGHGLKSFAR